MKIGFIGAGNMGEAYISSLFSDNEIYFYEVSSERADYISSNYNGVIKCDKVEDVVEKADTIVLAVKPQTMENLLLKISNKCEINGKIIVSIAAGVKLEKMEKFLGDDKKIVRVMPNTPILIKKGVSAVSFNDNMSESADKKEIIKLLESTGKVIEIEEKYMDVVTAISGSGPAYVFTLINSIADGGVKVGLSKKIALELAVETFIGAAAMIKETGKHPEELKDMVTSPGGTTAAGLAEMEAGNIRSTLIKTVEAAYTKADKLGK